MATNWHLPCLVLLVFSFFSSFLFVSFLVLSCLVYFKVNMAAHSHRILSGHTGDPPVTDTFTCCERATRNLNLWTCNANHKCVFSYLQLFLTLREHYRQMTLTEQLQSLCSSTIDKELKQWSIPDVIRTRCADWSK